MDTFKYFPLPWSAPDGEPEGAHCLDANGQMCMVIMWPVHPVEETEAVEQEAYRLMRLIPQLLNAVPGSPRKVGEDGTGELLRVLKAALKQTSCDGDLCMYEWHEAARRIISEVEEVRPSSVPVGEQKQEEGV